MKRIAISLLLAGSSIFAATSYSQNLEQSIFAETEDTLRTDRPQFPPPEQVAKIKARQRAISDTKIAINVGIAHWNLNNYKLNGSYRKVESELGVRNANDIPDGRISWTLGLQWYAKPRFCLWWEYVYGGEPSAGEYRKSSVSLSGLYRMAGSKHADIYLGAGVTLQNLKSKQHYGASLEDEDNATLQDITISSGRRTGVALVALMNIWPYAGKAKTGGFYLAGKYIISGTVSENKTYRYQGSNSVLIELDMNAFLISAGLLISM